MIRAIIADDEPTSARLLREVATRTGQVEVVGEAHRGLDCLQLAAELHPDLLFLDVRMPGMSGIEVAEMVLDGEKPPLVVFVTGHDEYAVKAFELAATDYVLKGPDLHTLEVRVAEAVARVAEALENRSAALNGLRQRVSQWREQDPPSAPPRLAVKDYEEGTVRLIHTAKVAWAERTGGHVELHTADKTFRTHATVDRLEQRLAAAGFLRANRGVLLNMEFIDHLIPNGDGSYDALLRDSARTVITVSRSRAKALLELVGL